MEQLTLDAAGIQFIHGKESCELKAYRDSGGVWSIGWGHTGPDVHEGLVITQEQADELFRKDAAEFVRLVNLSLKVPVHQAQYNALLSLTYNGGIKKDLFAAVNKCGTQEEIRAQFMRWVRDRRGTTLRGLKIRRTQEADMFFSAPWPPEITA
jgi:lysozyme